MKRALLLNTDYTPMRFITDVEAVIMFYKGTAEVITGMDGAPSVWDESFNSPSTSIRIPATMKLITRVNKRLKMPKFRKKVLFSRDDWTCQFCGEKLSREEITIDHLMPSSRGGGTSWQNCVSACKGCNKRKANKTPDEAGMKLKKQPQSPSTLHFWDAMRCNAWHDDWSLFLKERP